MREGKLVEGIKECTSNRCKVWGNGDYNILKLLVVMIAKLCECTKAIELCNLNEWIYGI